MIVQTLPKRSEVNPEFTWDLGATAFKADMAGGSGFAGRLVDSGAVLLEFLKAGSGLYQFEALNIAGADLSKPDAVIETFEVFKNDLMRLEKLLAARS